jgi:Tfp pilus assembly protein PilF
MLKTLHSLAVALRARSWLLVPLAVGTGLGVAVVLFLSPYLHSRQHLQAADAALKRHDLDDVAGQLQRSAQHWPASEPAQLLRIQLARRRHKYAEAERLLTAYEEQQGTSVGAWSPDQAPTEGKLEWLLLGVQQGDIHRHETALKELVQQKHTQAALILEAMAKGYLVSMQPKEALDCTNRWLDKEPKNALALLLRGQCWESGRQIEMALTDYERAVELAPWCYPARFRLAELLCRISRVREALAHYQILQEQAPARPEVLLGHARASFDQGQLSEAQQLVAKVLGEDSNHLAGLVEAGRLALHRGEAGAAEGFLQRATAAAPWHREAHQLLRLCLETLGKKDEAARVARQLERLQEKDAQLGLLARKFHPAPADADIRQELGKWLLENGEPQAAARWLFSALQHNPNHAATHRTLADYFDQQGQPKRAAAHRKLAG